MVDTNREWTSGVTCADLRLLFFFFGEGVANGKGKLVISCRDDSTSLYLDCGRVDLCLRLNQPIVAIFRYQLLCSSNLRGMFNGAIGLIYIRKTRSIDTIHVNTIDEIPNQ